MREADSLGIPLAPPTDPLDLPCDENDRIGLNVELDSLGVLDKLNDDVDESHRTMTDRLSSLDFDAAASSQNPGIPPALEGVTVVSIGIAASDIISSNKNTNDDTSGKIIGACPLEACSGTHVPDTSYVHSFVVTEVERMAEGRSRVKAVSKVQDSF